MAVLEDIGIANWPRSFGLLVLGMKSEGLGSGSCRFHFAQFGSLFRKTMDQIWQLKGLILTIHTSFFNNQQDSPLFVIVLFGEGGVQ